MAAAISLGNLPRLELVSGGTLQAEQLASVSLLVVEEGLVVLRTSIPSSGRRTITCHAGTGALILPPVDDQTLFALTGTVLRPISAAACDRLLQTPETARLLLEGLFETLRQKDAAITSMSRLHHVEAVARARARSRRSRRSAPRLPAHPRPARRDDRLGAGDRYESSRRAPARGLRHTAGTDVQPPAAARATSPPVAARMRLRVIMVGASACVSGGLAFREQFALRCPLDVRGAARRTRR